MSPKAPGKILIADNDEDVLLALEWALENEGFDTDVVLNSDEAMRILAQKSCDLIVLDDSLSDTTIAQVLSEFRRAGSSPMVVVTYHRFPSPDTQQNLHSLGVSAFISKQSPVELVHIVRYLLEQRPKYRDALSTMT